MFRNIAKIKLYEICSINRILCPLNCGLLLSNTFSTATDKIPDSIQILKPTDRSSSSSALKIKTISKAMKAYLERARKHEDFLKVKNEEFELGKLHLANMMGLDATTLTQDDIDKAIAYLFPSGLYEKKARPMMKPPIQMFPKEKAAQFDDSGRPFSAFFYTRYPNYFSTLHTLASKFKELDNFEDKMLEKGIMEPPSDSVLSLSGGVWLKIEDVQNIFMDKINEEQYNILITTLTRLLSHPYSFRCKDEIWKFRKEFVDLGAQQVIPEPSIDENGRPFVEMSGEKKHAVAKVIVRGNGSGKVTINDLDILYFPMLLPREAVMAPLYFCDLLGKVDVEATVTGPGESAQANAIRFGLAMCLRSFVSQDLVDKMRIAGFLTPDGRRRGRKLPGQKGNKAKYTWKKR